MAPNCEPLCHFGDRLYFTTFPHPAPKQSTLNDLKDGDKPRVRGMAKSGPSVTPDDDTKYYYFTIDDQLVYMSFYQDWGPLNIAMVYKACIYIHSLLIDEELSSYRLVLYTSNDPRRKANAALLMALFSLIVQQRAPWDAFQPIAELEFMPFRDAGRGHSDFSLNIQDCLWGIYKAMQNGLCDLNEFDVTEYEYYEKVENGDWNWITPNFIAFASPMDPTWVKGQKDKEKEKAEAAFAAGCSPTRAGTGSKLALKRKLPTPFMNCLEYFEQKNIKIVVRLNNELYDRNTFLERGINHLELYFDDGTNPTDEIVRRFIDISDEVINSGGVVAVHCKAGLGRTGTLIGAYLIWKYGFTASEAIAFMRIVRPGCVVGPQQQYMYCKQLEWAKWSAVDEVRRTQAQAQAAATLVVAPATPPAESDIEITTSTAKSNGKGKTSTEMDVTVESENVPVPMEVTVAFPPSTPPGPMLPPVTPSKHVAAATAKAKSIAPPGQPRKTPNAKRLAVDSSDEEDADEEGDSLPMLGLVPPAKKVKASPVKIAPSRGITASEQRPTRVTRSTAGAARKPGTALSSTSNRANAAPPPNKIPRLANGNTTRGTTATKTKSSTSNSITKPSTPAPTRRSQRPISPVPSRLPTLVPLKRPHHAAMSSVGDVNAMKAATRGKAESGTGSGQEWMKTGAANAVVKPGNPGKGERPGLRSVRRRRSSFSSADVVA